MSSPPRHGWWDRVLHRVAFATRRAQLGIADLEQRLFRKELAATAVETPVFITALPRAGTTMLLELLAACPAFASSTYRDMPFVLCPMAWRSLARRLQRPTEPHERAHGDGISISVDSPEAFEEVIWSVFWPEHYGACSITPWQDDDRPEFKEFFAAHRRKVVALRARDEPRARRYLAKNNLHVARIPALWQAVPEATVLVPFREPLQQAASLLRQHLRFLELHRADPFARRYMAAIGHFDFGANLRPIDFEGLLGNDVAARACGLTFWLDYWLATYRHVLTHASDPRLVLVDFDALAATRAVAPLASRLGIEDVGALQRAAARLQSPPQREVDVSGVPAATLDALTGTHRSLLDAALC